MINLPGGISVALLDLLQTAGRGPHDGIHGLLLRPLQQRSHGLVQRHDAVGVGLDVGDQVL